jgi:hypothetical protein
MRKGNVILSIWAGLNTLVAAAVTATTVAGRPAPALLLVLDESKVADVDARVLAVVRAQAAIANPLILAVCALLMLLVWRTQQTWSLLAVLLPLQAFAFISDGYIGGHNLIANLVSAALVLVGLGLRAAHPRARP